MSEYIERDAAVKAAQDGADEWDGGFNRNRDMYIEAAMDNVPTVDAVEVVRCKDCRYWDTNGYGLEYKNDGLGWCEKIGEFDTDKDWYCGWGERRSE